MRFPTVVLLIASCVALANANGKARPVRNALERAGIAGGICAVPQCGDGALAAGLVETTALLVHAFDADPGNVAAAKRAAGELLGSRFVVERLDGDRLPYADNFVDVVVLQDGDGEMVEEALRALRPEGLLALKGDAELPGFESVETRGAWSFARKPAMEGVDDWSHWFHGVDNNPVSTDTQITAPYITQWIGAPFFHAMPVVTTAAGGRIFVATGHISHHDREVPTLNTLTARNGYNGRVLWQRELPEGYLVHRSAFIAKGDAFYMIDGDGCLVLDPETGREMGRISIPGIAGAWVWMAMEDGVLYVLASEDDPATETVNFAANWRGWGWSNVEKNYFPRGEQEILWGFGRTLAAWRMDDEEVAWQHEEAAPIDSRGLGLLDQRMLYYVPGEKFACLDKRDGRELWANQDREKLELIEEKAKGLVGTPGFQTASFVLCTPEALFVQGQARQNVVAFAPGDGRFLWSNRKFHNNPNMLYHDGKTYISGLGEDGSVQEIDPLTGDPVRMLYFWKGSCTRLTGSADAFFCRGDGLGWYDVEANQYHVDRSARPGCNDGAIPANGMLYVGPWLCDCNQAIQGLMTLGPAGEFDPHAVEISADNLDATGAASELVSLAVDEADWETYRGDLTRSASSPATVPADVGELWAVEAPGVKLATPTLAGGLAFTGGDDGIVRCLDAKTGEAVWSYATGAPVMVAPTLWEDRALVGSGDGYVYAFEAATGELLWRFRLTPVERRIMLYGRLSSTWPVNSGVLVHDGTAYAAAGLINRDGTYVCGLDARTGELKWQNSTSGRDDFGSQPLYQAASAMGGLTVAQGKVWLASGNTIAPAGFDLETGEYQPLPAKRIPEWNTLIALKPEPAGQEILAFQDQFLLHGGRILYNQEGLFTTAAQFNVRVVDAEGDIAGPAFTPFQQSAVPPTWDADTFVYASTRYSNLLCWDADDVINRFAQTLQAHIAIDEPLTSENREKWDRREEINRGLRTFESEMRKTSKWPVIRDDIYATATARNAVACLARPAQLDAGWYVAAYGKQTGETLWRVDLPSEPRFGGLSIDRDGRVHVTLVDGGMVCYG